MFQGIFHRYRTKMFDSGARLLADAGPCQIRLRSLPTHPFSFPLSSVVCSRLICEHARPLLLSNKYDFCGTKLLPSAWQIDGDRIEFPSKFSDAVRSTTFEHFSLTSPMITAQFDLILSRLLIFGPTAHPKIYRFDEKFFTYQATIVVFLPSTCTGGIYRFINDNHDDDDDDEDFFSSQHIFDHNESNWNHPFILILPPDCQHEIEPIQQGFRLVLVYHLMVKSPSIDHFYSLLSQSVPPSFNVETHLRLQRLRRLFLYWQNHLQRMPTKLLIPLQHPFDYSPYFSLLFREKYRLTLQFIQLVLQSFSSSFLVYSGQFQKEFSSETRLFVHHLTLFNASSNIALNFDSEHQRTVLPNEFLGELYLYNDAFEQMTNRSHSQYHILLLIPWTYQWDLLFDHSDSVYLHLSYMLSLPKSLLLINQFCLSLLESLVRDRLSTNLLAFDQLIRACLELRDRLGSSSLSTRLSKVMKEILQMKSFREQFFSQSNLSHDFNRLMEKFDDRIISAMDLAHFFRQLLILSVPMKTTELCTFLRQIGRPSLRAFLINMFIRFVFKRRALPRHVLISTLCSILHLLSVDGSYSSEALLTVAYQIIKRVRKFASEDEILHKGLKTHLIPMLIHIYRDAPSSSPMSPAFAFIYQYSLNKLIYFCSSSSPFSPSSTTCPTITDNEALLMCSCYSCQRLANFLRNDQSSTFIYTFSPTNPSSPCLRHSLTQFPFLTWEYQHDPCTGEETTLLISKSVHEQEQKQLCFHLHRLLMHMHRL